MFNPLSKPRYLPILKWKLGEAQALGDARVQIREDLQPILVMPPSGGYDHELGRVPDPIEHIRLFGHRLHENWGKRIAFVDAQHLDDQKHKQGLSDHPLTELLERARLAGALACPVTGISRSAEYQAAVRRFGRRQAPLPISVRVDASDLESRSFASDLTKLLSDVSVEASQVALILDFGPLDLADFHGFGELLIERVNELPLLHAWGTVSVALTSFPEQIALKPDQWGLYPRTDWTLYQHLFANSDRLLRLPVFSDYAVEYPAYSEVTRVSPSAHLRYSTDEGYLIVKGKNTRKPNGYEAIFPVAEALVARPEYKGAAFSGGDAVISRLAQRRGGPGNASTWRRAATEHHLTLVVQSLKTLVGLPVEEATEPPASQPSFL